MLNRRGFLGSLLGLFGLPLVVKAAGCPDCDAAPTDWSIDDPPEPHGVTLWLDTEPPRIAWDGVEMPCVLVDSLQAPWTIAHFQCGEACGRMRYRRTGPESIDVDYFHFQRPKDMEWA